VGIALARWPTLARTVPAYASVTSSTDITVIEIKSEALSSPPSCAAITLTARFSKLVDRLSMANTRLSQLLADKN
jgi:hypothetical protein